MIINKYGVIANNINTGFIDSIILSHNRISTKVITH